MTWVDHGKYWELTAPQGTDLWKEGRERRVTTSVSGALAGRSKFKTPEEQGLIIAGLKEEIFTEEQLELMGHGTKLEPEARKWCIQYLNKNIVEKGLIVPKFDPFLGASIDGDIEGTDGIIEIKCPKWMYGPLSQYMDQKTIGKWTPPPGYYKHIWPTHYDQIQHALAVTGKNWCMYIVYSTSDKKIFTQKIPFDPKYWESHYKILRENYKKYVAPHLNGTLPLMPT
jgi:predicted phage-related endonuclease